MSKYNSDKYYDLCVYAGVFCLIMLAIACFLPGLSDSTEYTAVGNTWGFEYFKEISFNRHKLGIKSFLMLIWLGVLIGSISKCVKSEERNEKLLLLFITASIGLVLLIRTYDYAQNPSKLVFGHAKIEHLNYHTLNSPQKDNKRYTTKIDPLFKSGTIRQKNNDDTYIEKVKSTEETSFFGINAKKITYNKSYSLGEGFWLMLITLIVQFVVVIIIKALDKTLN